MSRSSPRSRIVTSQTAALQTLGRRIRQRREQTGLSQEAMAERCGVHRTYYSAIERGERNVTVLTLLRISRGLGTDIGDLMAGIT
jgi:transcriptional regulator with XRE-family HTH domain